MINHTMYKKSCALEECDEGTAHNVGEFETLVLLALLRLDNDAYGMEVREEIEKRTGRAVSLPLPRTSAPGAGAPQHHVRCFSVTP